MGFQKGADGREGPLEREQHVQCVCVYVTSVCARVWCVHVYVGVRAPVLCVHMCMCVCMHARVCTCVCWVTCTAEAQKEPGGGHTGCEEGGAAGASPTTLHCGLQEQLSSYGVLPWGMGQGG